MDKKKTNKPARKSILADMLPEIETVMKDFPEFQMTIGLDVVDEKHAMDSCTSVTFNKEDTYKG